MHDYKRDANIHFGRRFGTDASGITVANISKRLHGPSILSVVPLFPHSPRPFSLRSTFVRFVRFAGSRTKWRARRSGWQMLRDYAASRFESFRSDIWMLHACWLPPTRHRVAVSFRWAINICDYHLCATAATRVPASISIV